MKAMQNFSMGDISVEACDRATNIFNDVIVTIQPYTENPDGLGFQAQLMQKEIALSGIDSVIALLSGDGLDGLKAQLKKWLAGRPTSSRDRAPYEGMSKQTRFYTICPNPGHKSTTCTDATCPKSLASVVSARYVK
jgi:hypothetical protein